MTDFDREREKRIEAMGKDDELASCAKELMEQSLSHKYSYNFSWLGRPIIQYPQDIVMVQELIWSIQPDLIVETGIAHGGSLILSASMLELNAACGGPADAEVIGLDIDIRSHNREAIQAHPMYKRISMIEGSSIDPDIIRQVHERAADKKSVLVMLDSNHTHDHVLAELEAYAPLVTPGSYCVAFDTIVEDIPAELSQDRPWGPGNNAKTAVHKFLETHPEFTIDKKIQTKLLITVAPDGFLKRSR